MRLMQRMTIGAIAVALAAPVLGCDDTPDRGSGSPLGPSLGLTRIVVAGPDAVPLGSTAQFTATAHQVDGSTRDFTNEAIWRSSNESVLSLSSNGLATGHDRGEASVSAVASGLSAVKSEVMVLPPGTFRLMGAVRDEGVPVSGAQMTVIGGEGAGLTTSTAEDGRYRLYGVAGDVEVRISRAGYLVETRRVQVVRHETVDFDLTPDGSLPNVAGSYTLTISAAGTCTTLPDKASVRTYRAILTQKGAEVTVSLEGADFLEQGPSRFNTFRGTVEPDRVTFRPGNDFYYGPEVIERLPTATSAYLTFFGIAVTAPSGSMRSGSLVGTIETQSTSLRPVVSCSSPDHRFTLTP